MAQEQKPTLLRFSAPATIRAKEEDAHEFVISDDTLDRHGTVIPIEAWDLENYKKNPIVAYSHDTTGWSGPDSIIGRSEVRIEDGKLIGKVFYEPAELNPLADKIRKKVDFGTLSATSVGFHWKKGHWGDERKGEDPEIYYFDEVELLEFSIVNIPSNPNALKRTLIELLKENPNPGEVIPPTAPPAPRGVPGAVVRTRAWLTLHSLKNHSK